MPAIPLNPVLYEKAKKIVYARYTKPSAYRSGALVKKYKELGGTYADNKKKPTIDDRPLSRWFLEQWRDVNKYKTATSYPVFRPTIRITEKTPKTVDEIPKERLEEQSKRKQIIKGKKNLSKF
jgi:Family of unknown function (DUF5872)